MQHDRSSPTGGLSSWFTSPSWRPFMASLSSLTGDPTGSWRGGRNDMMTETSNQAMQPTRWPTRQSIEAVWWINRTTTSWAPKSGSTSTSANSAGRWWICANLTTFYSTKITNRVQIFTTKGQSALAENETAGRALEQWLSALHGWDGN